MQACPDQGHSRPAILSARIPGPRNGPHMRRCGRNQRSRIDALFPQGRSRLRDRGYSRAEPRRGSVTPAAITGEPPSTKPQVAGRPHEPADLCPAK